MGRRTPVNATTKYEAKVPECSSECRSLQHASLATSAVTQGTDEQVALYVKELCANCRRLVDDRGRTLLHMAASCGKLRLLSWLLRKKLDCDCRDLESGWTPLHRALFYGHVAVADVLIQHGASMWALDDEFLTPLDIVMKDRPKYVDYSKCESLEVYTWGANDNCNLGFLDHHVRDFPIPNNFFLKKRISIKKVVMSKLHTVFLSTSGAVFSCGRGHGGRLGLGCNDGAVVGLPKQVAEFGGGSEVCSCVAVGLDHSVYLTKSGSVWTCGSNSYCQLGHSPPPAKLLAPKRIETPMPADCVCVVAGNFHTAVVTGKAVYTFGLNAGQLGHEDAGGSRFVVVPRRVVGVELRDACFTHAAASNAATVCVAEDGRMFVLHDYRCQKLTFKYGRVSQVQVLGGRLDVRKCEVERDYDANLLVAIVTTTGELFISSEKCPRFARCLFSLDRPLRVTKVALFEGGGILFATYDGEGFVASVEPPRSVWEMLPEKKQKKHRSKRAVEVFGEFLAEPYNRRPWLDVDSCYMVCVDRLANVHRAVDVACDPKGANLSVIQAHARFALPEVKLTTESNMSEHMSALLSEAGVDDNVHDVVIQVGTRRIPAHAYVVASYCERFRKVVVESWGNTGKATIVLDCLTTDNADVVQQLLQSIYTGRSAILSNVGNCWHASARHYVSLRNPELEKERSVWTKRFRQFRRTADDWGIDSALLETEISSPGFLRRRTFKRDELSELWDLRIVTRGRKEIKCHRCILVARSEFFSTLLSPKWLQRAKARRMSTVRLPFPVAIVEFIVDYLYTDECEHLKDSTDLEFICTALVTADCWMLPRVKEKCEVALAEFLTLRNVIEMLDFAMMFSADLLKKACFDFIGLNLATMLESGILSDLSDNVLVEISENYRELVGRFSYRVITPDSSFSASDCFASHDDISGAVHLVEEESKDDCDDVGTRKADGGGQLKRLKLLVSKRKAERSLSESENRGRSRTVSQNSSGPEGLGRSRTESLNSSFSETVAVERSQRTTSECSQSSELVENKENLVSSSDLAVSRSESVEIQSPAKEMWLDGDTEAMDNAFPRLPKQKFIPQKRSVSESTCSPESPQVRNVSPADVPPGRSNYARPVPITLSMFLLDANPNVSKRKGKRTRSEGGGGGGGTPKEESFWDIKSFPWHSARRVGERRTVSFSGTQKQLDKSQVKRPAAEVRAVQIVPEKPGKVWWNMKKTNNSKSLRLIQIEELAVIQLTELYETLHGNEENIIVERAAPKSVAASPR